MLDSNAYAASLYPRLSGPLRVAVAEMAEKLAALARYAESRLKQIEATPAPSSGLPSGAIFLYAGGSCPAGYTAETQFDDRIPIGADGTFLLGVPGGTDTHDHAVTGLTMESATDPSAFVPAGGAETTRPFGHTHPIDDTTTTTYTGLPAVRTFLFCKKD